MTGLGVFVDYVQHYLDGLLTPAAWVCRKIWGTDPERPERNPFMVLMFGLIGVLSILTVVGLVPAAPSLAQAPDQFTVFSSGCIAVGSIAVCLCLLAPGDQLRFIAGQLALAFAGFGFLCYGVALFHANGFDRAILPAAFSLGASLGTGGCYAQLWWFLRKPWKRRPRPERRR